LSLTRLSAPPSLVVLLGLGFFQKKITAEKRLPLKSQATLLLVSILGGVDEFVMDEGFGIPRLNRA
jgi:hypothetical protein